MLLNNFKIFPIIPSNVSPRFNVDFIFIIKMIKYEFKNV